jgi:LPXTG-motif cell wall-anchored protein
MYTAGMGAGTATVATAAVLTLPNTGSSVIVTLALSVAAGLITWGIIYSRSH